MKYHALFVIFEKAAKFAIVVCCKVKMALLRLIRTLFWLLWKMGFKSLNRNVNPYKPNGISKSYQLDQTISVLRVVGLYFTFLFKFQ